MYANLSYPRIIEDYKNHLRNSTDTHSSFESFCLPYHVRVKSVRQWMHRHGLDVGTLYYEVVLEKCKSDPNFTLPSPAGHRKNASNPVDAPANSPRACASETLKGVCITFPDGIIINIRQTTASALTKFIECYNKQNDISHVQPE